MKLMTKPIKPKFSPLLTRKLNNPKYESWRLFLPRILTSSVDVA